MPINQIAENFVKLTLKIGQHHEYYVDAFYGPKQWLKDIPKQPLDSLLSQALALQAALNTLDKKDIDSLRLHFLVSQVSAMIAFIKQLNGEQISFDEESLALYDAISPHFDEQDFNQLLIELNSILPSYEGENLSLNQRLNKYRSDFIIPKDKIAKVFSAAINKSRQLTLQHIALPDNESFKVEYVTDQVWSAYNWFKGNAYSLIEVNTDFPIYIERAIDLASHEGYPGHHVFNTLIEQHLYKGNGWIEYCIYPLFSPLSLLAEGSANYGIEVAFDKNTRFEFEQDSLFPLAGLDATQVSRYYQVQALLQQLSYVDNMVARRYLDKQINKEQAIDLLMKYSLTDHAKSSQRIKFIEYNRSYVINYNLGQDITKAYIERLVKNNDPILRWQEFAKLLATPRCASLLV
ncbi:MAG: hypothetical protein V7782_00870 [Psychromonas sp.]